MSEMEEIEKYVKEDTTKFPSELLENPLKYISNYYESIYPNLGKKVFYLLCLVPVSLIIPKIPRGKKYIKQKINLLLISNPSTGKTSIAEEFEKITFNPLFVERITRARLSYEIKKREIVSLIISDIANSFLDEELVKVLEGILGDEGVISDNTMRNIDTEKRKKVDAIAYLSGTPENIAKEILSWGLLSRTSPLLLTYSEEEHEQILDFVNEEMGEIKENFENKNIKEFYLDLWEIQKGNHFIPKIEGYIIPKEIKNEIKNFIKPLVRHSFIKWGVSAVRETEEVYRFLVNHAFLNIYKKYKEGKIENGKLIIDEIDLKVAKFLIKREIRTKEFIIDCVNTLNYNNIKTINQLREWTRRNNIKNPTTVKVMEGMIKK